MSTIRTNTQYQPNIEGLATLMVDFSSTVELAKKLRGFKVAPNEVYQIGQFQVAAKLIAATIEERGTVDERQVRSTISSGVRLENDVRDHIEAFIGNSPTFFMNRVTVIKNMSEEVWGRHETAVTDALTALTSEIASEDNDIADVVAAHVAVSDIVEVATAEAKAEADEREREAMVQKLRERNAKAAKTINSINLAF